MSLENKYFIIPWEEFHYDLSQEQERAIILDMDKKELEVYFGYGNGPHGNDRVLNPLKSKNTKSRIHLPKTKPYSPSSFTLS